jgi:phosphopantetheinyl transferase
MHEKYFPGYVRCSFIPGGNTIAAGDKPVVEVYYMNTGNFADLSEFQPLKPAEADRQKAASLQNAEYRNFILSGYAFLRQVLARKIGCQPDEIQYGKEKGGKPFVTGDPLFFNISHTRSEFVFSVSDKLSSGIDIEEFGRKINFEPVIKRFFSSAEVAYILNGRSASALRFFLLWTRKESLLKLIGTGMTEDLTKLEVHKRANICDRQKYSGLRNISVPDHIYIYSAKTEKSFISVALPCKAEIAFHTAGE